MLEILLIFMIAIIILMIRSQFVHSERIKMIDLIFKQENYKYYLKIFDMISYNYMVFCFWVWPISKMWPRELDDLKYSWKQE